MKKTCFAFGCEVPDCGIEHNAQKTVADRCRYNADNQELEIVCEIKHRQSCNKENEHRNDELVLAVFVGKLSDKDYSCDHRNNGDECHGDQRRCNLQRVAAEKSVGAVLEIDYQIWEENLKCDRISADRKQG